MPTRSTFSKRNRVALAPILERKLITYALTGAAGLGLASPGRAAIDYTLVKGSGGPIGSLSIDLNHDGISDFTIHDIYSTTGSGGRLGSVLVTAANGNGVAVDQSYEAHAFSAGNVIGPKLQFSDQQFGMGMGGVFRLSSRGHDSGGEFLNQKNKFLGLRFSISGQTYYGWARVDLKSDKFQVYYELVDYAYQTTPNTPIEAGQGIKHSTGSSLGALAFGAAPSHH